MTDAEILSTDPYWWSTSPVSELSTQSLPEDLDLLIIGAGYTGLSAALTAFKLGAKVAVVDATKSGFGASTRNGGMVGAHPRVGWNTLASKFGDAAANKIFSEASDALDFFKTLIFDESIDCDFQECGRIQLAWTPIDHEQQKSLASIIKSKSDVKVEIVNKANLESEIFTNRYFGGLLFPEHGSINPAKFHKGLLDSVRERKIVVLENSPVKSVVREKNTHKVFFDKAVVSVRKVLLATNGYTINQFSWFKKRVFPVPSFLIATEDIDPELLTKLAPGRRMMVETRAKYSYFRISPNGRKILFGGRAAMKPIDLDVAAKRLKTLLDDIWPEIKSYKISNVWTGNTGYSFNHLPHVGKHNEIYYAMGFSGSGTVLAPYLGAKAAFQAFDDARGVTGYSETSLKTRFFHFSSKPYFLGAANFYYQYFVDPKQRRAGKKKAAR